MVPVYHCLYEGVLALLCVVDKQLEAASIPDLLMLEYVCDLKVLILGGSYQQKRIPNNTSQKVR